MLQTERPDRVAAALADGQIALFVDGSPYALIAPITLFHLMNASDDTFMRWQYGTFVRVIRLMGALMSLLLPGIYVAVTLFHVHFIPLNLLTSIAETRARVPFSVLVEVVFMELSFYLINEAGTRIPSQLGSALAIVGALILGQAAVEASIISPILIIVISLTGLGGYAIPSYGLSVGVQIARMAFVVLGGLLGIYGLVLGVALMTGYLEPRWNPSARSISLRSRRTIRTTAICDAAGLPLFLQNAAQPLRRGARFMAAKDKARPAAMEEARMTGQRRGVCVLGAAAVMLRVFVMTVLDEPYLLNAGWLSTLCGGLMGMIALLPCLLEGPSGRGGFETLSGGVGRVSALLIAPVLIYDAAAVTRLLSGLPAYSAMASFPLYALYLPVIGAALLFCLMGPGALTGTAIIWRKLGIALARDSACATQLGDMEMTNLVPLLRPAVPLPLRGRVARGGANGEPVRWRPM